MSLLNPDDSWEDVQGKLDTLYERQGLPDVLDELYKQQIGVEFIRPEIISHINDFALIRQRQDDPNSPVLMLQYNPSRAKRGTPDEDRVHHNAKHHIAFKGGMPCFCCKETIQVQWPHERGFKHQVGDHGLLFLPNISPIFHHHFTIASIEHMPQYTDIDTLITLAKALPNYWIIQNGPQAGATNPEHFHTQCFKTDLLPVETFERELVTETHLYRHERIQHPATVSRWTFNPASPDAITAFMDHVLSYESEKDEHRVNVLIKQNLDEVTAYVVYRHTDRRSPYYKTGQPGYAEAAGVVSTIDKDRFNEWKQNGWNIYTEILSAI